MASLRVVTLSDCLLSPLGTNKELAGHMVLIYQSASQPDPPGKQLASLFFPRGFARCQRWAVSAGRRASVRINRNKKERAQGLGFYHVTTIALYGCCREAGQIVELSRLRKVDRPFRRGTGSLFRKSRKMVFK